MQSPKCDRAKVFAVASIYDLLQRMFTYYGFDFKGHLKEGYAIAHKGSIKVIMAMKKRYVDQDDMNFFADILAHEGADRGIFIALTNFSDGAVKVANKHNILMWDRERFESEIGKVILSEAEGLKRDRGEELFEQVLGLFDAPGKREDDHDMRIVSRVEGDEGAPMVRKTLVENEMILTPVVGLEAASRLAQRRIKHTFKYDLQLIPFYIFEYECEIVKVDEEEDEGAEERRVTGTIGVNALTEEAERWTRESRLTESLEIGHTKLEPKVSEDEATKIAKALVIDLNTQIIEYRAEKAHVTVYERKRMRPKEDAIMVDCLGLVYLPVWGAVGTNGVVVIDATNGEILKEDK